MYQGLRGGVFLLVFPFRPHFSVVGRGVVKGDKRCGPLLPGMGTPYSTLEDGEVRPGPRRPSRSIIALPRRSDTGRVKRRQAGKTRRVT